MIFLSGTSMGAYGTWSTAHEFPESFTAIAPVSGGVYEISQYQAHRFQNLPIWAFHNRGDEIIRCKDTENMIEKINKEGGNPKVTIYEVEINDADVTLKKENCMNGSIRCKNVFLVNHNSNAILKLDPPGRQSMKKTSRIYRTPSHLPEHALTDEKN